MNLVLLFNFHVLALLRLQKLNPKSTFCLGSDTLAKDVDRNNGQERCGTAADDKRQPGKRQSSRRNVKRHEDSEPESDDEKERMVCEFHIVEIVCT